MASLYEAAILLQFPTVAPVNHYTWADIGTTNVNDTGISALDATTNGTVTRGYASMVPGDTEGFATGQATNKNTVMATRGDNGVFDRPGTTNKLSLVTWFRPDDLRSSADNYPLIMKGTDVYGVGIEAGRLYGTLNGVSGGQIVSDVEALIHPGRSLHIAMIFDGAAQSWDLYVNGVNVKHQQLSAGSVVNHAAGGTLQLGGYSAFGNEGAHGRMQHTSIFNAQALTVSALRGLYQIGTAPPGVEGDEVMFVYPWSREIVASGGNHETINFRNWGPWPVSLSQGGEATPGGGITLAPRGGTLSTPSRFKGVWSACLDSRFGHYPLGIEKVY